MTTRPGDPHHQPTGSRQDPVYVVRTGNPADTGPGVRIVLLVMLLGALVTAIGIGAGWPPSRSPRCSP